MSLNLCRPFLGEETELMIGDLCVPRDNWETGTCCFAGIDRNNREMLCGKCAVSLGHCRQHSRLRSRLHRVYKDQEDSEIDNYLQRRLNTNIVIPMVLTPIPMLMRMLHWFLFFRCSPDDGHLIHTARVYQGLFDSIVTADLINTWIDQRIIPARLPPSVPNSLHNEVNVQTQRKRAAQYILQKILTFTYFNTITIRGTDYQVCCRKVSRDLDYRLNLGGLLSDLYLYGTWRLRH